MEDVRAGEIGRFGLTDALIRSSPGSALFIPHSSFLHFEWLETLRRWAAIEPPLKLLKNFARNTFFLHSDVVELEVPEST